MNQKVMPNNLGVLKQEECNTVKHFAFLSPEIFNLFAEKIARKVNSFICEHFIEYIPM